MADESEIGGAGGLAIILAVIMALSCPDKAAHQRAVEDRVYKNLNSKEGAELGACLGYLYALLGGGAITANEYVKRLCALTEYHNWYIFSYARSDNLLTIGVFGKVFLF